MSTGAIIAIIVLILLVAAALIGLSAVNRRRRLRARFGPEYDRAVSDQGRRDAEAELAERERRVRQLDIRPLTPTARAQYTSEWTAVQEQFVDAPSAAVTGALSLVTAVMRDRGYPTEGFDQTVADLSVEHAATLDHYRAAHDISQRAVSGAASTEELRQAMIHYRALFADLLGRSGYGPGTDEAAAADGRPPVTDGRPPVTDVRQSPAADENRRAAADPDATPGAVTGAPISGSSVSGNPVPSRPQER
jgi:Tfp pilus assembly protein PilX